MEPKRFASPQVSVILPVKRGCDLIRRAVDSILAQTFQDFELLLIENGSGQEKPLLLSTLATTDPRIRLLSLPQADLVAALNLGLSEARGKYIARMDADDLSRPGRLERQVRYLRNHPRTGLVSCLVQHDGDPSTQAGYALYVEWVNSILTHGQISSHRFVESPLVHPSVMFRRGIAAKHGAWRAGPFPEDYDLWLRWLEAGVRMEKIPEVLLDWGDPPDRLSRTDARYSPRAFFSCKAKYLARWLRDGPAGDRRLLFWGAGRETRRRLRPLFEEGIQGSSWIDIDPRKSGKRIDGMPLLSPEELPPPRECFVVSCVSSRGAREAISAFLVDHGFVYGLDFILAA